MIWFIVAIIFVAILVFIPAIYLSIISANLPNNIVCNGGNCTVSESALKNIRDATNKGLVATYVTGFLLVIIAIIMIYYMVRARRVIAVKQVVPVAKKE